MITGQTTAPLGNKVLGRACKSFPSAWALKGFVILAWSQDQAVGKKLILPARSQEANPWQESKAMQFATWKAVEE